jgi:hypothetical protein
MNTEQKAIELVDKFKKYVHGYLGSSMLTNHEYPEQILSRAKEVAIITVDEILQNFEGLSKPEYCAFDCIGERKFTFDGEYPEHMTGYDMIEYWEDVKIQIGRI